MMTYRNSSETTAAFGVMALWLLVVLAGAVGWIWNIVKLWGALNDPITGMEIARVIGIFLAPVGAVLGFL